MKFDFSGYATKNNLKCTDGRTILKDAFKDNHGQTVPLVWQHMHNHPSNILGHAKLENRQDGVYAYCVLNDTESANTVKELIAHGDISALSIYANKLVQKNKDVIHGVIKEVSLVLSGANPEAYIDNITMMHSDGSVNVSDDEAVIYTGLDFEFLEPTIEHKDDEKKEADMPKEETVGEVFETLTEKQKNVVYALIAQALEDADAGDDDDDYDDELEQSDYDEDGYEADDDDEYYNDEDYIEHFDGGDYMKRNVFDQNQEDVYEETLSHAQFSAIVNDAQKFGSFKESFLAHAQTYGIENIDRLFPEAKLLPGQPGLITRDMEWVGQVMSAIKPSPFSRIKSTAMDITADEARALGYVKGKKKKEEVVKALKRVTLPTTIYKKQKLDRDDVIDIVDLDIVAWLKKEMRTLLNEELARAFLIGDGRNVASDDKINEENIRPIYTDDDLYAHKVEVSNLGIAEAIDDIIRARKFYKGSGAPVLYTSNGFLTDMLLLKDLNQRYIYNNETDLATKLRVSKIVEVPVIEGITREDAENNKTLELLGIIVNLRDYVVGADQGGQVSMFDDFDIDYNQQKYLIETRCSGALVQPKSALVIERVKNEDDGSTNP